MSAGLSGFAAIRPDSSNLYTPDEYANQANAYQASVRQSIADLKAPQPLDVYANQLIAPQAQSLLDQFKAAGFNLGPEIGATVTNALRNDLFSGSQERGAAAVGGLANLAGWTTYANGGLADAQKQYDLGVNLTRENAAAQYEKEAHAAVEREQNRVTQQQAYTRQLGGGFLGGLLSDSYGKPFAGTITGTGTPPTPAPAQNLGFGVGSAGLAPSASASTGLNPWATQAPGPTSPLTGFGGPFGAVNPWAAGR